MLRILRKGPARGLAMPRPWGRAHRPARRASTSRLIFNWREPRVKKFIPFSAKHPKRSHPVRGNPRVKGRPNKLTRSQTHSNWASTNRFGYPIKATKVNWGILIN
uniref:Uncharacterized protein n=1 Tax=Cacopsylla melanoneura TaxID=428564 RepID=A0A8D8SBI8_9HEMI